MINIQLTISVGKLISHQFAAVAAIFNHNGFKFFNFRLNTIQFSRRFDLFSFAAKIFKASLHAFITSKTIPGLCPNPYGNPQAWPHYH